VTPATGELSLERCLDRHWRRGSAGLALLAVAETDSTNSLARRLAGPYLEAGRAVPRVAVVARRQSAGRGRRGRRWISPAGQGIYTSLLLPVSDAEALTALPLRVPLALCEALDGAGVDCRIKWPNDLVVNGRKLGGVLIEALAGRAAVVGYGINGSQNEPTLPTPGATSLRLAAGAAPDLSRLAVDLAQATARRLGDRAPLATVVEAYRRRSAHRPGEAMSCRLGAEQLDGRFGGFDERGRLRLVTSSGERVLGSAELLGGEAAGAAVVGGRHGGHHGERR
jgi:BirA family biotin operon repressor/biotin-[acetyl-CoA-carboxylase] ligase